MEKLKRYDIFYVEEDGTEYAVMKNTDTGRYFSAYDVEALEEARKMSIEELREQFEKTISPNLLIMENGIYVNDFTQLSWLVWVNCADKNNILKEWGVPDELLKDGE